MTTPLQNVDSTESRSSDAEQAEEAASDSQPTESAPFADESSAGVARRLIKSLLWGSLFVGTAAASAVVGAAIALTVPLPGFMGGNANRAANFGDLWQAGFRYQVTRPVNILVMGIDEVPNAQPNSADTFAGRTDTLLLVRVDAEAGTLNVMSIPRDTRVQIPGFGMDKINQANVLGGPELVAQTVGYNLGNLQIDRYVRINTSAFREMVDLVGGIEVNVPTRMEYTDRTQGLYIDLYPGWQTLNGDQAEQFARYRKDSGDIGRVQRQQMLLKALRERLTNPTVLTKLPQALRVMERYVDTNLTLEEMLAIANFGLDMESNQLQMVMLPGRFSTPAEFNASYWLPNWEASATIMQNFFQAEGVSIYADNSQGNYVADLSIAVQNASGQPDQAASVADYLRENGFSNVYIIDDLSITMARTEVVAQRGDVDSARTVESLLGVGLALSESTGDLNSDITIRVGQDWVEQASQLSETQPQ
ncbi:LCP family protein [Phormidium tenue]|uniref:LytR family transcriptional regulator n=1 Tax=Phormidium tenue NIES-30 TaxID=549789 RepID=A0A1U7JB85_9CYAN|nr:LCP family protein [Phormidium tenue]MBD2230216.1 LCP family protein [Phormidium tenue FACHB-1052]OKH50960.1 LytR family transcriptional regulator [Phormidium tenue NIES-30]